MGLLGSVTQALGLSADPNAGAAEAGASREQIEAAVQALQAVNIPEVEAMKMIYEMPELVGSIIPEELRTGMFEQISVAPGVEDAQRDALGQMQELAQRGVSEADIMDYEDLQSKAGAQASSQQATILQEMANRGSLDSGAQLAAQLSAGQAATTRSAEAGRDLAREAMARKERAIQNVASQAGQMGEQQYGRQFKAAGAESELAKQNAMFRNQAQQQNLGERQRISDTQTQLRNQQQQQNKQLLQQEYENQMRKAGAVATARTGAAQNLQQQSAAQAQAAQQSAAGTRELLIGGAKAAMGGGKAEEGGVFSLEAPGRTAESVDEYPGATVGPDNMLAEVKEGELALNAEQQKELFDFINDKKGSEMKQVSKDLDEIKKALGLT